MKKTKILMPILASTGVVAVMAPMIAITSCSLKTFEGDMQESSSTSGEFALPYQKSKLSKNASIKVTASIITPYQVDSLAFSFILGANEKITDKVSLQIFDINGVSKQQLELKYEEVDNHYTYAWDSTPYSFVNGDKLEFIFNTNKEVNVSWQTFLRLNIN